MEEGLKFLTCRLAIRKEGMVRTWMDSVVAFAFVGITFEMIENVAFGGAEILNVIVRALAPAHFVFGVIMGYFWGKYLVTGLKRYRVLPLWCPSFTISHGDRFSCAGRGGLLARRRTRRGVPVERRGGREDTLAGMIPPRPA